MAPLAQKLNADAENSSLLERWLRLLGAVPPSQEAAVAIAERYDAAAAALEMPPHGVCDDPLSATRPDSARWRLYFATAELRRLLDLDVQRTSPPPLPSLSLHTDTDASARENCAAGFRASLRRLAGAYAIAHNSGIYIQGLMDLCRIALIAARRNHKAFNSKQTEELFDAPLPPQKTEEVAAFLFIVALMKLHGPLLGSVASAPSTIARTSQMFFDVHLRACDPDLHLRCTTILELDSAPFCVRWLRVLFTREWPLDAALVIWDGLVARMASFLNRPDACTQWCDLLCYLCVASLINVRDKLMQPLASYVTAMKLLLPMAVSVDDEPRAPGTLSPDEIVGLAIRLQTTFAPVVFDMSQRLKCSFFHNEEDEWR